VGWRAFQIAFPPGILESGLEGGGLHGGEDFGYSPSPPGPVARQYPSTPPETSSSSLKFNSMPFFMCLSVLGGCIPRSVVVEVRSAVRWRCDGRHSSETGRFDGKEVVWHLTDADDSRFRQTRRSDRNNAISETKGGRRRRLGIAQTLGLLNRARMVVRAATRNLLMRTYYFDMIDGATARDRVGMRFPTTAAAIEHGKQLAQRLRGDPRIDDPNLYIRVIDESGAEVHCEPVYKGKRSSRASG
jgi:hypothetical protein